MTGGCDKNLTPGQQLGNRRCPGVVELGEDVVEQEDGWLVVPVGEQPVGGDPQPHRHRPLLPLARLGAGRPAVQVELDLVRGGVRRSWSAAPSPGGGGRPARRSVARPPHRDRTTPHRPPPGALPTPGRGRHRAGWPRLTPCGGRRPAPGRSHRPARPAPPTPSSPSPPAAHPTHLEGDRVERRPVLAEEGVAPDGARSRTRTASPRIRGTASTPGRRGTGGDRTPTP